MSINIQVKEYSIMYDDKNPWGEYDSNKSRNTNSSMDFEIQKLKNFFKRNLNNNSNFNFKGFLVLAIVIFALWMLTGIYVVKPNEEGIELIFGKYIATTQPGLRYNLPAPIGSIYRVRVTTVNETQIGYNSHEPSNMHNPEGKGIMLTGDENIIHVSFVVQWRIRTAYDYLFKIRDYVSSPTIKNASESAMKEIIGKSSMTFVLEGKGRAQIVKDTKELLQTILNKYHMGIEVLSVQLKRVDPPDEVIDAFRDVQSARADRESKINNAYAYRNDLIPRAYGIAAKIKQDSEAYQQEVVNNAQGEIARFNALYKQYKLASNVMKKRIYLETMAQVLKHSEKVVLDKQGIIYHLPLSNLLKQGN